MSLRLTPRTPLLRKLIGVIRRSSRSQAGGLSRREFLAKAGVGLGAAVVAAETGCVGIPPTSRQPTAIIGAGAAGLTAAYRMMRAGADVTVFEGSSRLGGRIFTLDRFIPAELNDGTPMFCELGGELVDSNHQDLIDLAKELGLEIQELKQGDPGVDYYYFGGRVRTEAELIPAFHPLAAQLAQDAVGLQDDKGNYTAKATRFDNTSIRDYLRSFDGRLEPWVLSLLDVAYETEYGRATSEQSALNLTTYLSPDTEHGFKMYGDSDESKRVKGGNSRLIEALSSAIAGRVNVHTRHRLTAIAPTAKGDLQLTFQTPDGSRDVTYPRVILALPFTMLRNGRVTGIEKLGLSSGKVRAIAELGYGTNAKAMIAFKSRFWRKAGPVNNGSIYTDEAFQTSWETSRSQQGPRGILTDFLGGRNGADATADTRFDTTLRELERIFPGAEREYLGKRVLMHWPSQEFVLGSYTCPLVGQFTTLLEHCGTPELDGRLLFAGEHTSIDFSGFMCGAVESGNRVAREALGARARRLVG
jgi:monoamine oxidase